MSKRNYFIVFVLVLLITCFSTFGTINVSAAETNNDHLKDFSIAFLDLLDEKDESKYEIENIQNIYTLDEKVFGYKVNFNNINNGKKGYINFNKQLAVIEYSFDSEGSAFDIYNNSKIYYNGDLEYYFENKTNKKLVSITDRIGRAKKNIKIKKSKDIKNNIDSQFYGKASVPGAGDIITNPSSVLNNIVSVSSKNITGYSQNYVKTSNYSNSDWPGLNNHCGPTAVVNMLIWFDNNGYPNLITGQSHPYRSTFTSVCNYMGFTNILTLPGDLLNGLYNYFHAKYSTSSWNKYTDYWVTHDDVYNRVNQNIPIVYLVGGHSMYGYHYVVMVGYQKIVTWWNNIFGVKCYSNNVFMRIADGWCNNANRYINYEDASSRAFLWLA